MKPTTAASPTAVSSIVMHVSFASQRSKQPFAGVGPPSSLRRALRVHAGSTGSIHTRSADACAPVRKRGAMPVGLRGLVQGASGASPAVVPFLPCRSALDVPPACRAEPALAAWRDAAVTLLQNTTTFRHASRRLLADLVERGALHRLDAQRRVHAHVFLLVVLDGTPTLAPAVVAAARRGGPRGDGATRTVLLRRGVYWHDAPELRGAGGRLVALAAADVAQVLLLDEVRLTRALAASPALANVAALRRRVPPTALPERRAHLVWMARAPGLMVPLETAGRLLAAAVASEFGEPAGVVTAARDATRLAVWEDAAFRSVPLAGATAQEDVLEALSAAVGRPAKLHHLFYVHPADPLRRPRGLAGQRFHRVVYVTETVPSRIPHGLEKLLQPALVAEDGSGACFSAFVPTLLVGRRRAGGFRVEPLDAASAPPRGVDPSDAAWSRAGGAALRARGRLRRDQCRIALDGLAAATPWEATWRGHAATAQRWARAVTNRRVGIAVSGGGACAFRTVPLLRALRTAGVPLDLVSGVSGGALIGAYLSAQDVAGLARAERRGVRLLLAALGAVLWSGCIERQVDRDLGGVRVEELETIFLPVTTELGDPPAARVVAGGTVGEAVRASASAPLLFGPTWKAGRRYADGAAATMLPARLLTERGADLTVACTCVPPPTRHNPFAGSVAGRLAYRCTPLGRVIDAWVTTSLLLNTASRLAGSGAQVAWEPSGVGDPLGEALRFDRAPAIVADSTARDAARIAAVSAEVQARWRRLGT